MTTVSRGSDSGLHILDSSDLELLRALDELFRRFAKGVQAQEKRYPFLLNHSDLDRFDYFDNFPHLGMLVAPAAVERLADALRDTERPVREIPAQALGSSQYCLPSAACYNVYLDNRDVVLPESGALFTTASTCFRNETHYDGLQRLLGFTMREIVYIGSGEGAKAHINRFKPIVEGLIARLGLELTIEVATDPFFDKSGERALMQRLFPVKEEFVVDGLAIASVNYHRNFFGERCNIRDGDRDLAHTSCVAFGLERWVHVLTQNFGSADAALEQIRGISG
jgi:seryl-tRNA synthetase